MWKENKKEKPQPTPSILVRKRPIPSQSFQNSNIIVKESELSKPSTSTSPSWSDNYGGNSRENNGKMFKFLGYLILY